jgi:hypothetical protein
MYDLVKRKGIMFSFPLKSKMNWFPNLRLLINAIDWKIAFLSIHFQNKFYRDQFTYRDLP